jgi:hypothetical protein
MGSLSRLPDTRALGDGLGHVLCGGRDEVRVLDRTPAIWASTYPSEVVTCAVDGSAELKLYCKYMAGLRYDSFGHRGGVPYEVDVYRHVLGGLSVSVPRFYGSYVHPASGDVWLVLEFLDQSLRVAKGPQPESLVRAAGWLGQFHAATKSRASSPAVRFLSVYDTAYYLGWSDRTLRFADQALRSTFPWLETLCARFSDCAAILVSSPQTIIHGEFYPHNILLSGGQIYPIDWESAAIGPGEIDLATLTEGWRPEHVQRCEVAYQLARWGGPARAEFRRRIAAARLYLCFRWMGDQPAWTLGAGNHEYFDRMRGAAGELGLL